MFFASLFVDIDILVNIEYRANRKYVIVMILLPETIAHHTNVHAHYLEKGHFVANKISFYLFSFLWNRIVIFRIVFLTAF